MLRIAEHDIELNRGDAVSIAFTFDSDPPEDGTIVKFSVNYYEGAVIQKDMEVEDGIMVLELDSSDTNIREWTYTYGLYIQYTETNGYAPLTGAIFRVKPSEAYQGAVIL